MKCVMTLIITFVCFERAVLEKAEALVAAGLKNSDSETDTS